MDSRTGEVEMPKTRRQALRRAFVASLAGTSLEYYDFAVFSSAAALFFGQLFFAQADPLVGALQAFATYAVGYVARPLGGLLFGRLGDVIGRKKVLVMTLLLIGIATCLIGLLPTYAQVGALAPLLLVTLRLAQGVGVGGEWGSAALVPAEFCHERERGFWASAVQTGPAVGTLLANGVLALLAMYLSQAALLSWGWRCAFLLSALLVGFGLWLRTQVEETPLFREVEARGELPRAPLTEVLTTQRRALFAVILSRMGPDVFYSMFAVFVLTYATQRLHLSRTAALTSVLIGSAMQLLLIPLSGWLSDRYGRRRIYAIGTVGAAAWTAGFFALAHDFPTLLIGVCGALVLHSMMYGPQAAFIAELFPVRLRATGSTLGYTLASVIAGGLAPLILTWLLQQPGAAALMPAYVGAACAVTLVGLAIARKVDEQGRGETGVVPALGVESPTR
jgi:MFS family permease